MRFSVVIPTYARPEPLARTLAGVLACDPPPLEVVVVDGDAERSAWPLVRRLQHETPVRIRYLEAPRSVTLQRNRGIDVAAGDVLVFLDDDVDVEPDLFARLELAYDDPGVIAATGRLVEPDSGRVGGPESPVRRLLLPGAPGTFTRFGYPRYVADHSRSADVETMPGCFMTTRRDVAAGVRFDERLRGYALAEDEDFSYRVSRVGRIAYRPEIRVRHRKLGFRSLDSRWHGRRVVANRAYLFRKNFPQTRLARLQFALLIGVLVCHRIVNREWRAALGLLEGAATLAGGGWDQEFGVPPPPVEDAAPVTVSVVIPTYGRPEHLRETLETVLACDPPPAEVVVVDADPDGSARPVVEELDGSSEVALRHLAGPLSIPAQRNRGIDAASGDVLLFLDDDMSVDPALFARLAETFRDREIVGATGKLVEPDMGRIGGRGSLARRIVTFGRQGTFTRYGYPRYLVDLERPRDVEVMPGGFTAVRRDHALRLRFDENLSGYALAEDEDFAYRLSRLGRLRYVPEMRVFHKKLGFSSLDSRELGRRVVTNRAYLFRKNFRQTPLARLQFGLLIVTLVGHRVVNREWRGALGLIEGALELGRGSRT